MDLSLLIIAGLGLVAIVVGNLFKRFVPEIVVFLALGVAVGPEGLNLINDGNIASLDLLTQVALGAVIFLIGDRLRLDDLREQARKLIPINVGQVVLAGVGVFFATQLAGAETATSLILALIATETGVLTVSATVKEEKAAGPSTDLLLSSVGVTNVATALLFGFSFPFILATSGASAQETARVFGELIVLSTIIGLAGGWILTTYSRAIETSGELLLFLLVILTGVVGASLAVEGSVVVATLITGLFVANRAPWLADRLFATVRALEAPIYLVFFVVAGAGIHLDELTRVGTIGIAYAVARTLGKIGGATLGGLINGSPRSGFRVGQSLLPHAGMAIALAALVVEQAPDFGATVSGVVLGSIVVFELGGPLLARRAIRGSGEAGQGGSHGGAGVEPIPEILAHRSFSRVLVPLGSVAVVLPRLPFILDLVGTMRAELIAVHISRPGSIEEGVEPEVLRLVGAVAEERNITVHKVHKVSEAVAQSLVAAARDHDAELVVMGEPARTSLLEPSRWGLISQRVVRDVDVPVLVYPVDPSNPEKVPSVYLRQTLNEPDGTDEEPIDAASAARGAKAPSARSAAGESNANV